MSKRMIVFHEDHVLLSGQDVFWKKSMLPSLENHITREIALESISFIELATKIEDISPKDSQWLTVKSALQYIDPEAFHLLAKGLGVIRWDRNHQFCGRCSKTTILTEQALERHCKSCQINYYPRISPAIIVLIRRGNELLMARGHHYSPGVYGLIAGFVEPGETLEAAVNREVFEEVGIKIRNITYYGSQPWPFPDSLMVGFTAEYASGEIKVNHHELEDAGWYRHDQLPGFPSSSISIATEMIRQHLSSLSIDSKMYSFEDNK